MTDNTQKENHRKCLRAVAKYAEIISAISLNVIEFCFCLLLIIFIIQFITINP